MTKQEFLSASLQYGLKIKSPYGFRPNWKESTGIVRVVNLTGDLYADIENRTFTDDFIPIVRHISDLTKECVQADYNDGKPFVPIVELNKLFNPYDGMELVYYINSGLGWRIDSSRCNTAITFDMMIKPIKQLFIWHFDLITEDCEKVYVTDEFNPYK